MKEHGNLFSKKKKKKKKGTSLEFVPKRVSSEQNVVSVNRERVARRDSRRAIAEKLRQGLCSLAQEEFECGMFGMARTECELRCVYGRF